MDYEFENYDRYVDYKKLYLKMMRASEAAIPSIIEVQHECEEAYLDALDEWKRDNGTSLDD